MDLYRIREELKTKTIEDIPLKVTFYARVSTDKYEQASSLANQVSYFEELIQKNPNWTFVEGYVDEGISGTSTEKRDSFLKMIEDGKNKKFDLIYTKEVSRFARDTIDSISNTRELLKYGVGVKFLNDNINTLDADSEFRLTIMASMAQDEVRKLSERVKFGHQKSIKNGRVLGNSEMWGYEKKDCKLTIIEEEAKMIRRIFELYTTGKYGLNTVAKMIYDEGYKNKNGNKLSMNTIGYIIKNPKYKGYFCGNKSTIVDYKLKTKVQKDKEDWIIHKDNISCPPIVTEEIWELANRIYNVRSAKTKDIDKRVFQNRYTFSGKLTCNCHNKSFHRKVYKYKTKDDEVLWVCPHNNMSRLDKCKTPVLYEKELIKILRRELTSFISKKESILFSLANLYKENIVLRDYNKEIEKLNRNIEKLNKEKDKLLTHNINEIINDLEFKERNDICNNKIKAIREEIDMLILEQDKANNVEEELKKIEELIENKVKKPTDEMMLDLLDRIVVYNAEDKQGVKIKIYLKIGKELEANYINPKSQQFNTNYTYD